MVVQSKANIFENQQSSMKFPSYLFMEEKIKIWDITNQVTFNKREENGRYL